MLVTSSIIPYLNILYPHMGPPTTPGLQAPHHLNPALGVLLYALLKDDNDIHKHVKSLYYAENRLRGLPSVLNWSKTIFCANYCVSIYACHI